ncbi:MAG: TonB-dependent receptor plug domain-containing protein [Thermoguttaceae bacterium]
MDAPSRSLYGAARGLILFLMLVNLSSPVHGQISAGSSQGAANSSSQAAASNQGGVDAGSLDKLLDMAEKDVGQLSNVNVSSPGHTGSPSLDQSVSTVERQASTVGKTPAAVFVITNEMIRRSGAQTIPDALRMVPGVQVAQISSDEWAVSARGFDQQYSNLLLVQIDGRTVYDLFFGGVLWDVQDLILEDVDRIEVVRGPGATVWGANAVNGVINIITKKAQDTQGVLVQGGGGSHELGFTNARAGGRMGEDLYYRFYGRWFDRGPEFLPDGGTGPDAWHQGRSGFRMDYDAGRSDAMTLQGDYYDGKSVTLVPNQIPTPPFSVPSNDIHVTGENILYRWKHTIDDDSDWTFQTYYDRTERHYLDPAYGLDTDLLDLDFQHRFPLGERHEIIWGCGYRFWKDSIVNTQPSSAFFLTVNPPDRFDNYFSYFVQDQITLEEDRWFLIGGSKFEHDPYTNFEFQPTVRLLSTPNKKCSLWAAVSRAVHMPTQQTDFAQTTLPPIGTTPFPPFLSPPFPPGFTVFPQVVGNPGLQSEELLAYELGVRVQATERFSWDLALFYNQYDNLFAFSPNGVVINIPSQFIFAQQQYQNGMSGQTYGAELALNYSVSEQWRLQCAYTYTRLFLHLAPGMIGSADDPGDTPCNEVYLQSSWDMGEHWQFDLIGRYVDVLLPTNPVSPEIPNYIALDTRLAWHSGKNFEVSVAGRNLTHGLYSEFVPITSTYAYKVGPEVYGQITWRY